MPALEAYLLDKLPGTRGPLVGRAISRRGLEPDLSGAAGRYGTRAATSAVRQSREERARHGPRVSRAVETARRLCARARPVIYCEDESVIGAPFYCMERRHGIVLRRKLPPGFSIEPATARQAEPRVHRQPGRSFTTSTTRPPGWATWASRSATSSGRSRAGTNATWPAAPRTWPEMEFLMDWFPAHMPPQSAASLVHNDYKFDNIMLDPNDLTKIVAVLDWEMCTLGDPMMDFGTVLAYWVEAKDPPCPAEPRVRPHANAGQHDPPRADRLLRREVRLRHLERAVLLRLRPVQGGRHHPANLLPLRAGFYQGRAFRPVQPPGGGLAQEAQRAVERARIDAPSPRTPCIPVVRGPGTVDDCPRPAEEARLAEDQITIVSNLSYRDDGCKACILDLAMPKRTRRSRGRRSS